MGFCFEIDDYYCGIPNRVLVLAAFFHFIVHGIFVTAFVFSNICYPPFYYVDYLFGISGAVLILVALIGAGFALMRTCQCLRSFLALITILNVLLVLASSFYYAIERWYDVITTAFTSYIRKPIARDFPDIFWKSLTLMACLMTIPFTVYLIFITSYMCNKWKPGAHSFSYPRGTLFTDRQTAPRVQRITMPRIQESTAYPRQ